MDANVPFVDDTAFDYEFHVGDKVYITEDAERDVVAAAWPYVNEHPYGIVRGVVFKQMNESHLDLWERQVAIEFPDEFDGGHFCYGTCQNRRGQFITAIHLVLLSRSDNNVDPKEVI